MTLKQVIAHYRRLGLPIPQEARRPPTMQKATTEETSPLEVAFAFHWRVLCSDLPAPETQRPFDELRGWRWDFCWERAKIAVEMDGRHHQRYREKYLRDIEKRNAAQTLGWQVYVCTSEMIDNNPAAFVEIVATQVRASVKNF